MGCCGQWSCHNSHLLLKVVQEQNRDDLILPYYYKEWLCEQETALLRAWGHKLWNVTSSSRMLPQAHKARMNYIDTECIEVYERGDVAEGNVRTDQHESICQCQRQSETHLEKLLACVNGLYLEKSGNRS